MGMKKGREHVGAVEIEEMDLVIHDEEETKEVGVVTPKEKKRKTSKKKSPSKTKSAEPFTLAKKTKFALKFRKMKVVEKEESEEEEESDEEQDKMVMFWKRIILKGRLLGDLEEEGMVMLLEKLQMQGWKDMVLQMDEKLARTEIVEFMANFHTAPKERGPSKKVPVNNKVKALVQESGAKDIEIERLKKRLTEVEIERDTLRAELGKEKEKNEGILHDMLKLLQARNQESGPSQP
ncbi:spindle pole component BBP1-like [Nicotiana tomentosiformis]|uniref:spindle pole component BBP1-like n=1 Tax=Nicotiana tomentosiformis TaxID=4098 RepID=UPI00388C4E46